MSLQHFAEQTTDDVELAKVHKCIVGLQSILADHASGKGCGCSRASGAGLTKRSLSLAAPLRSATILVRAWSRHGSFAI